MNNYYADMATADAKPPECKRGQANSLDVDNPTPLSHGPLTSRAPKDAPKHCP